MDPTLDQPPPPKKKKNKTKKPDKKLGDDDKKKLAKLVEVNPVLWSLKHPQYKRTELHIPIWNKIGESFGITGHECKKIWRSIRDALRYQLGKPKKVRKSGESGDEGSDDDNFQEDGSAEKEIQSWVLFESVKFLLGSRGQRTTMSTPVANQDEEREVNSVIEDADGETDITNLQKSCDLSKATATVKSNYDYASRKRKYDDGTEKLASGINELINLRKSQSETPELKYYSMYANLDRMLKKLPEESVEDLNIQFINLIRTEMKKDI